MARPRKIKSIQVGEQEGSRRPTPDRPLVHVTIFERRPGGNLHLRWWTPGTDDTLGRWNYRALGHASETDAQSAAYAILAGLSASEKASAARTATVTEVLVAYNHDRCAHTKGYGPKESERRIALWSQFLGENREVKTIDFPLLDRFVRERRAGTIKLAEYELGQSPSNRAIGADLEFLRAALNHACLAKRDTGDTLISVNPMGQGRAAYKIPTNSAKRRPIVSYDRFEKILAKADSIDGQRLFAGFMILVEALGWRVSAICQLRACDVDLKTSTATPHGRIFKRAETDKMGVSHWLPMSPSVRAGIDRIRAVNPAIGEWPLFPAPRAKVEIPQGEIPKAWTRHYARALLERAEGAAKLEKVVGGDFHPYRRKWATERKHLPDVDVARAGGWSEKDPRALKTSYQQVDEATLLAVVSEPTKLREVKPAEHEESA